MENDANVALRTVFLLQCSGCNTMWRKGLFRLIRQERYPERVTSKDKDMELAWILLK